MVFVSKVIIIFHFVFFEFYIFACNYSLLCFYDKITRFAKLYYYLYVIQYGSYINKKKYKMHHHQGVQCGGRVIRLLNYDFEFIFTQKGARKCIIYYMYCINVL